ncbi:GNAT family N-acetyltransferase [Streptomyces fragilis]|uniref:GNAT family N-acetyltransferase n=1 Tax=Streptomyces fragilis TaxID=67301 RepID=A0ABV2YAE8_9ACTN|nr:GNAT family N-acetyltransferase [Streptomyces fragilis]
MSTVTVTRAAEDRWEAAADDGTVVGRGDVSRRPDGRLFLSVDVWQDAAFDRLAAAMLAELPAPLHTLVGDEDHDRRSSWERLGFTVGRRERAYDLPTDPRVTGLGAVPLPAGVAILPAGEADESRLRALDRAIREEVGATVGWHTMPAELVPGPPGDTVVDPSKYAVAVRGGTPSGAGGDGGAAGGDGGAYVGLVRVVRVRRRARVGLIAVRADERRRGTGRALLAHALNTLARDGVSTAWAEVDASNTAALSLVEGAGARRAGACLELVRP